jgi:hypothetical protein
MCVSSEIPENIEILKADGEKLSKLIAQCKNNIYSMGHADYRNIENSAALERERAILDNLERRFNKVKDRMADLFILERMRLHDQKSNI